MDEPDWDFEDEFDAPDDGQDDWDDDNYYDVDDFGDDEPREPNCFDCYDTGIDRHDRSCRTCRPSPLRVWWWNVQSRYWRLKRRLRRSEVDDPWSPPF